MCSGLQPQVCDEQSLLPIPILFDSINTIEKWDWKNATMRNIYICLFMFVRTCMKTVKQCLRGVKASASAPGISSEHLLVLGLDGQAVRQCVITKSYDVRR